MSFSWLGNSLSRTGNGVWKPTRETMDHGKFPVILAPVATGTGNEGAERQRAAKKFIKKQLFTKMISTSNAGSSVPLRNSAFFWNATGAAITLKKTNW